MYGLANMSLFLLLVNYIAALVSVQLLRGDLGSDVTMNFGQLFNAFLAVYQVFSSENWTDILYGTSTAEIRLGQTVIVVLFISAWMLFANCEFFRLCISLEYIVKLHFIVIVLQMFIAVINENFDVAEEAKKGKQASNYWEKHQTQTGRATWMRNLNPYRWVKANPVKVKVENLPSNLVLPMQKSLVENYTVPRPDRSAATTTVSLFYLASFRCLSIAYLIGAHCCSSGGTTLSYEVAYHAPETVCGQAAIRRCPFGHFTASQERDPW